MNFSVSDFNVNFVGRGEKLKVLLCKIVVVCICFDRIKLCSLFGSFLVFSSF